MWRPATGSDVVSGVPARFVAAPSNLAEMSETVAAAHRDDLAVVIRGNGTKLDWGNPPARLDLIIDTRRLSGTVEHAAGDLITVVRAGTPVDGLDFGTQQLALDAPGATVGGAVASNASGPRRLLHGTARDLLIGITVVRPDGTVTRSGGRVVKNVAGYDLSKLYTGSLGTLGVITECVFRLHPVPQTSAYVSATLPVASLGALLSTVRAQPVVPSAVEIDHVPGGPVTLTVLLEGTPDGVADRTALLEKELGGTSSAAPPPWWGAFPDAPCVVKLGVPLTRVPHLLTHDLPVRGSAGCGILYAGAGTAADVASLRAAASHAVVLTAPASLRPSLDVWGPVPGIELMRRVKDQFDPAHSFAPGRFAGGI